MYFDVPQFSFLLFQSKTSLSFGFCCDADPFLCVYTQGYEEEDAEAFDVSLTKNTQGLGITIAGYVGDKNSGEKLIFLKIIWRFYISIIYASF